MRDIIISISIGIIIGLVIGLLKYPVIIYRGPNSNKVIKQIFIQDGNCYKLLPEVCQCP